MTKPLHIKFWTEGLGNPPLQVEFDVEMHHRASDFDVYRNNCSHGRQHISPDDSALMRRLIRSLMADEHAGVTQISVKNFMIAVHHSSAVSDDYIKDVIEQTCREAGYTVIDHPREPGSPWCGARVSELDHPLVVAEVLARSLARHKAEQAGSAQA